MKLNTATKPQRIKPKRKTFKEILHREKVRFLRDWQLHMLMIVPVVYMLIFDFGPMYGAQIAFRDFRPKLGITGSPWVGLKWVEKFMNHYDFVEIVVNTLSLSMYSLLCSFSLAVIFALMLNTMRNKKFQKVVQNISYMPHFISTVILVGILQQCLNPVGGFYGAIYRLLGNEGYPTDIRGLAETFPHLYVWSGIWQNLGWSTIIYIAALTAVSPELHEAAEIDGASRWKRVWAIDFPTILPTAAIVLIMNSGSILSVGFEKVYMMQTSLNRSVSEVISTYVYKKATGSSRDFSYGSAIGLFNSFVNCAMLIFVNWLSTTLSDNEVGLF